MPEVLTDPPEEPSFTDQSTAVSLLPVTFAENCWVAFANTVALCGVTAIWTTPAGSVAQSAWLFATEPMLTPPEDSRTGPTAWVVKTVSLKGWPAGGAGRVSSPWSPVFCTFQSTTREAGLELSILKLSSQTYERAILETSNDAGGGGAVDEPFPHAARTIVQSATLPQPPPIMTPSRKANWRKLRHPAGKRQAGKTFHNRRGVYC